MSSENKKRKEKNNPHSYHGMALKQSDVKLKGRLYYNSSTRQKNKKVVLLEK